METSTVDLEKQVEALKAALREALDEWGGWAELFGDGPAQTHDGERIAELRKQFLDI